MKPRLPTRDEPQRQFTFISEGRLQAAPTVRHLLKFLEPVSPDDFCQVVLERFLDDDALYALPVVDALARPLLLLDRTRFIEYFSKPYSREIFGRRSVLELVAYPEYRSIEPIVVEENCSIEDVAQMVIDAGMQHMVTGFIVTSQDHYLGVGNGRDLLNIITQRTQAELHFLAHYDNLTGLPNRMLLGDRLEHACRDAERKGLSVAILFIDVDRFKQINDSFGHPAGDAVLRAVADRLKSSARSADTVARLGGDEFAILMEDIEDPAHVDMVALRVVNAMREPVELLGHSLVVTVSVGSATYPSDDVDVKALLAKADAAMYEVKSGGRNGFCKFSPDTTMYKPASLSLENELRQAIDRDELVLHFQPQVKLANQKICGVEALVRWQHPVRGLVSPVHFIPVAEESGLIVPLGEWVLSHALRQMKDWQEQGLPPLRISINISALQFQQHSFPEFLRARLAEYGVDPRLVELELTESVLMQNADHVLQTLEEIKFLGVSLAIDDFGTGFSSLSYLRRFPIDRLKIDQSFVRDIESLPVNESIARAIVALAESLSLEIVAEGIETSSEKGVLEHMRCFEGQGYLFSRPLPADDFVVWLNSQPGHFPVAVPRSIAIPHFVLAASA